MFTEEESRKRKLVLTLTLFLAIIFFFFVILEDRTVNMPPINLTTTKTTVNIYANDVVLITTTEVKSTLDETVWYIFAETKYIEVSTRLVDSRITTLQEYLKTLP